MAVVSLPKMMKPATLLEPTVISKAEAARGKMVLRADRRLHMNVGDPNCRGADQPLQKGVGYARSSGESRKGKSGRSEGALL